MNRSKGLKNKNSRRFSFSNILAKEVLLERMEDRIVPAYVSGDFGWAATIENTFGWPSSSISTSATDSNGNIYLLGGMRTGWGAQPNGGTIMKVKPTGVIEWARSFSGNIGNSTRFLNIYADKNGNVFLTGEIRASTFDFDPNAGVQNRSGRGGFVLKLDTNSTFQWVQILPGVGEGWGSGQAITTDSLGNVLIAGSCNRTFDFDPSENSFVIDTGDNITPFVEKLDPSGNFIWARVFTTGSYKYRNITTIVTDSNNNVFVGGEFEGQMDLDPSSATYTISSRTPGLGTNFPGFYVKLDTDGMFKWGGQIDSDIRSAVRSITSDVSNNVLIAGNFSSTVDFDQSATFQAKTSNGDSDAFLLKLNSSGILQSINNWGGTGYDDIKSISFTRITD